MKLTKKISLLIALAVLVTVGGVYAQWTYTGTHVGKAEGGINISMQSYQSIGNQQGYFTTKYSNLEVILKDDYDGETPVAQGQAGDYKAEIAGHGSMIFFFQPYAQTTEAQMAELKFNITFSEGSAFVFNGTPIFEYTNATNQSLIKLTAGDIDTLNNRYANLDLTEADLGSNNELGLYYYEISFDHLVENHLAFSAEFDAINNINNLTLWDQLNDAVKAGVLNVTISDVRETAAVAN